MKYALNIASADGRILSACVVLPNGEYGDMPVVGTLPDGNVYEYRYINGEYIHDPLPAPEETEPAETLESRVETLETSNAELAEAVDMILSGVTE